MASEKHLNQLEQHIEALRKDLDEREKRINARIDTLIAAKGQPIVPVATNNAQHRLAKAEDSMLLAILPEERPKSPINVYSTRNIDKKLGSFYGSTELRESIKDAHVKMHATVGCVQKVRDNTHNLFVRQEIEQLFRSVRILTQVFNRMMDRMELQDCSDELILDVDMAEHDQGNEKLDENNDV